MQEWIDQAHLLDPNDPANADTFDKFHVRMKTSIGCSYSICLLKRQIDVRMET